MLHAQEHLSQISFFHKQQKGHNYAAKFATSFLHLFWITTNLQTFTCCQRLFSLPSGNAQVPPSLIAVACWMITCYHVHLRSSPFFFIAILPYTLLQDRRTPSGEELCGLLERTCPNISQSNTSTFFFFFFKLRENALWHNEYLSVQWNWLSTTF